MPTRKGLYQDIFYCSNFPMNKKPNVKSYFSVTDFLSDVYKYRKTLEPQFSYELWAQDLGLMDKSFLRQLVIGRRTLTEKTFAAFCTNLNFSDEERHYFRILMLYSKAKNVEQRKIYGEKLRQLIQNNYQQDILENRSSFMLKPLYPRLLVLLSFTDITKTPESLAQRLDVSLEEINEGLKVLADLGLAKKVVGTQDSNWESSSKAFKVPQNLGSKELLEFHKLCLLDAIEARAKDISERRYRSMIVPLEEKELQQFWDELDEFATSTLKKYDRPSLNAGNIFQINFNIHSVTKNS